MTEVLRSWLYKRAGTRVVPEWLVPHVVGKVEPNGSFLIRTKCGAEDAQARALVGHLIFVRNGVAYARAPEEARELLAELEEADRSLHAAEAATKSGPAPAGKRLEADVADRTDDTDDITVRLGGSAPAACKPVTVAHAPVVRQIVVQPPPAKAYPAPLGMPPSIELRHPGELKIDDSYQRSIDTGPSRALIERIARGWDWRMCLPLVVSKRDDGFYVIDGQHRHAAALRRGDIPFLPCCIAVYDSVAEEAAMFVAMNRARRAINRLDDFHAAQAGGDADALAVTALVESVGFTVSRKTGSASWVPGEVAFTSAIGGVRRKHGDSIVRQVLAAMADCFAGQRLVAGSSVFTAVARILVNPPEGFSKDRLLLALRSRDMKGWASFLTQSKGGDERAQHLREALLMAYDDAGRAVAA